VKSKVFTAALSCLFVLNSVFELPIVKATRTEIVQESIEKEFAEIPGKLLEFNSKLKKTGENLQGIILLLDESFEEKHCVIFKELDLIIIGTQEIMNGLYDSRDDFIKSNDICKINDCLRGAEIFRKNLEVYIKKLLEIKEELNFEEVRRQCNYIFESYNGIYLIYEKMTEILLCG